MFNYFLIFSFFSVLLHCLQANFFLGLLFGTQFLIWKQYSMLARILKKREINSARQGSQSVRSKLTLYDHKTLKWTILPPFTPQGKSYQGVNKRLLQLFCYRRRTSPQVSPSYLIAFAEKITFSIFCLQVTFKFTCKLINTSVKNDC